MARVLRGCRRLAEGTFGPLGHSGEKQGQVVPVRVYSGPFQFLGGGAMVKAKSRSISRMEVVFFIEAFSDVGTFSG